MLQQYITNITKIMYKGTHPHPLPKQENEMIGVLGHDYAL